MIENIIDWLKGLICFVVPFIIGIGSPILYLILLQLTGILNYERSNIIDVALSFLAIPIGLYTFFSSIVWIEDKLLYND